MPKVCPEIFDPTIMHISELFSLVLDGTLYPIGDAFVCPDTVNDRLLRSQIFARYLPGASIANRHSASWIWGAKSSPPHKPQVCLDPARRSRLSSIFDAVQHPISPDDTLRLTGIRVTTPFRTALDIMLTSPQFDEEEKSEVQQLLAIDTVSPMKLCETIEKTQRSGSRRARERVRLLVQEYEKS